MLRLAKKFVRLEALGSYGQDGRFNDAADPVSLEVRVTYGNMDPTDPASIRESQIYPANPASSDVKVPFRLATGLWAVDLTESLYVPGNLYSVSWRYCMTPNNLKVDHDSFTFQTPAPNAREPDGCVIFGVTTDAFKVPLGNVDVTAEIYKDVVTMSARIGQRTIRTDIFGNWFVELPRCAIARFVLGEASKVIKVPDLQRASLASVPVFQPTSGRVDRFGYPYP